VSLDYSLDQLTEAYLCREKLSLIRVPVWHPGFYSFCRDLGWFVRRVADVEDELFWRPVLREFYRLRTDLMSFPLPFDKFRLNWEKSKDTIHLELDSALRLYPELGRAARSIVAQADQLTASTDAPLLDAVEVAAAEFADDQKVLVVPTARKVPQLKEFVAGRLGYPVAVMSPAGLRHHECYGAMIAVGPGGAFSRQILDAPRAPNIISISFEWAQGLTDPGPMLAAIASSSLHASSARLLVSQRPLFGKGDAESAIVQHEPQLSLASIEWTDPRSLAELAAELAPDDASEDMVEARAVSLEGSFGVFVEANDQASVMVLELLDDGRPKVKRLRSPDLEVGMFVLLRASGGGDYVVAFADSLLGTRAAPARKQQEKWKSTLRSLLHTQGTSQVAIQLRDLGAVRASPENIRRWQDVRSIRPDADADLSAILSLTGLEGEREQIVKAMALIERAHIIAGQRIRKQLLGRVLSADLTELRVTGAM
jgi:hypothetical protein